MQIKKYIKVQQPCTATRTAWTYENATASLLVLNCCFIYGYVGRLVVVGLLFYHRSLTKPEHDCSLLSYYSGCLCDQCDAFDNFFALWKLICKYVVAGTKNSNQ